MAFKPTHTIIRTGIDVMFCCVDFTSDLIEVQTEDEKTCWVAPDEIIELKNADQCSVQELKERFLKIYNKLG